MSIASVGDSSSRFGGFSFFGSRSRISWGAVLAGAAVAAATSLLLSLLGAALGAGSFGDLEGSPGQATAHNVGAGIWTMLDLALSMALGGYVASRLSGTHSHLDGELHGITMWAVATLIGVLAFAHAVGGAMESVGFGAGPAIEFPHKRGQTVFRLANAGSEPADGHRPPGAVLGRERGSDNDEPRANRGRNSVPCRRQSFDERRPFRRRPRPTSSPSWPRNMA